MLTSGRRCLAALLTLVLAAGHAGVVLAGPAPSTLKGRLFTSDLIHPAEGVTIQVVPEGAARPAAAATTDPRGRFTFSRLPAGNLLLVLSDRRGTPLAAAQVKAIAGQTQTVTLALPGPQDAVPNPLAPAAGGGGFLGFLATPLGATVAIVAGALVVSAVADSASDAKNEPPSSPHQPR